MSSVILPKQQLIRPIMKCAMNNSRKMYFTANYSSDAITRKMLKHQDKTISNY